MLDFHQFYISTIAQFYTTISSTAIILNVLKQHCHLEVAPHLNLQYRINFRSNFEYKINMVMIHLDRLFLKLEHS